MNPELEKQIEAKAFTSHKITLRDGSSTIPDSAKFEIERQSVTIAIRQLLNLMGLDKRLSQLRALDLGCLEGGFTVEFAKWGVLESIGVEARRQNYELCELIKDHFSDLNNLKFMLADVKELDPEALGTFHMVFCCGLLYHLDNPVEFLRFLRQVCDWNGFLFLDTHYAPRNEQELEEFVYSPTYGELREITVDGKVYQGRDWHEYDPQNDPQGLHPWYAVSNASSFVLTYHSLLNALETAGFGEIYRMPYSSVKNETSGDHKLYRAWLFCRPRIPYYEFGMDK